MKQASDSLLTLHPFCFTATAHVRALPRDGAWVDGRLLTPFRINRENIAKRRRVLLVLSRPLLNMFRSRLGEGRIRSLLALPFTLIACCTMIYPAWAAAGIQGLTINLREEATVLSAGVFLKDVADLQGSDRERIETLARVPLGLSPTFGLVLTLSRHRIWESVHAIADTISEASFTGAAAVQIRLQGRQVQSSELVPVLKAYLVEVTPWKESEIEIRSVGNLKSIELPPGDVRLCVQSKAAILGYRNILVPVEATQAGKPLRAFWVAADVRIRATILVAAKAIPFGKNIAAEDVMEISTEIRDLRTTYIRKLEDAVGRVSCRILSPGDPFTRESVMHPFLVRSGETVRLSLERNGIMLSTLARAEQNGRLGQVIRVRNLDFARILKAQVTGRAEVKMQE
jgi:flagella basal body P-ring formation protein FlgA